MADTHGIRRSSLIAVAAALVASLTGCQAMSNVQDKTYVAMRSMITSSYNDPNAEAKMARGEQLYAEGKYSEAHDVFFDIAENSKNPVLLAEKARFMDAECWRMRKKYPRAVAAYNRLLQDHPAGVYRERAATEMYAIAYEWLQKDTLAEIEAEQAGTRGPWWTRKPDLPNFFDSTRPLLDTEGEALKTLENVHTHDIVGPNADKALFWAGYVNFYRGRFDEADHFFSQLVEMHKDSKLRQNALELAVISKNLSTGGAVYDSAKASEALKLIHYVEASDPVYSQNPDKSAWLTRQKLAIRMQLAQKDFELAEYYRRTKHPQAAYFYYEIVCRRYPGTKFSDVAKERLAELEKLRDTMEADKERRKKEGDSPFDTVRKEWDHLIGKPIDPTDPPPDTTKPTGPQGPTPPKQLPADLGAGR